jgi:ArsR family transcriptional regulator
MAVLEITQSKASRHLAALRNAGIAVDRKEGLWSYYSLRPAEDKLAIEHLALLKTSLSRRPDAKLLLKKLNDWLKEKQRGQTCLNGNARGREAIDSNSIKTSIAGETN